MITLGIESSCDETGVALVKDEKTVLSNIIASSLKLHCRHGGVIPEIASRMQLESIAGVFQEALKEAGIKPEKIGLIAFTGHPGLPGSLTVGTAFARGLAAGLGKPLAEIDHVYGHIYANALSHKKIVFPATALVVSGGHTSLFYLKDFSAIRLLGQTRDDACGEAFDKVAKIMGLGYPGGPLIEKIAGQGDKQKIKFSFPGMKNGLDFSFSGIKTAVLYYLKNRKLTLRLKADLAASFQESVIKNLTDKSLLACRIRKTKTLLVGGGVAANSCLRQRLVSAAREEGVTCLFPDIRLCMDNAAMIAGLGGYLYQSRIPRFKG
ncbi:MAG: tRNA (adenosine(37)-N6)-threonylcarbamoyltransferase complex transferase subunit TsaD [Candidatus Omnitrophota bacterium]